MGKNKDKNRAKKLAKKKAKKKLEKRLKQDSGQRLSQSPVFDCFIEYYDGIMTIFLVRKSSYNYNICSILVDLYCLGVKNAFITTGSQLDYKHVVDRKTADITPEKAKRIILDAVEYADNLGFKPHKDFKKAFRAFDSIDADNTDHDFEMGKNGKPFFIAGPFDSPEKCNRILNTLKKSCGEGNFHYTLPDMEFDYKEGRYSGSENL